MGELERLLKTENKELPAFPEIGIKILQTFLTKSPREIEEFLLSEREIVRLLISTANRPQYRKGETPVDNPRMAILVIGENTAKILALGLVSQKLLRTTFNEFNFYKFWARALSQALAGFYFSDLIEPYPSHLPVASYLLDFGIILLYLLNPEKYLQVLRLKREGKTLIEAEEEIFGVNHAIVGAEYFETYALPRRFILNLYHHHKEEFDEPLPPEVFEDIKLLKMIDHGVGSFFSENREERWKNFKTLALNYLTETEIEAFGEVFPKIANPYLEIFNFQEFRLKTLRELEEEKQKELEKLKLEEKKKTENLLHALEEYKERILKISREKRELEERLIILSEKIEKESIYDELTETYRESYFLKRLKEELLRSKRYKRIFSLLTVEIDNLNIIRERFGLGEEENFLKYLCQELVKSLRRVDLVSLSKDRSKIYILLPETPSSGAMVVARKTLRKIEEIAYLLYQEKISGFISIITFDPKNIDPKKEPRVSTFIEIGKKGLELLKRKKTNKIILLTIDQEIET